jgi:four helix bundle protein
MDKEVDVATDFRDLRVWDEAMQLTEVVYEVTGRFPTAERFGLVSQLRRAAVSIPSCIAEGNARGSTKDYLRFLAMAKGSLAELQTQVLLAARLGFATQPEANRIQEKATSVSFLLQSLRKALNSKLDESPHSPFPIPHSRSS